jgi:hypothetical protein
MRVSFLFALLAVLITVFITAGCSSDAVQRSAYEAVHGAANKDCRQYPSVECQKHQSYDDYQRQRQALER